MAIILLLDDNYSLLSIGVHAALAANMQFLIKHIKIFIFQTISK